MTEPTPIPATSTDPITAILLAVTRIEGNLAGALDQLKRHDSTLDAHSSTLNEHGNRLVALETARAGDSDHERRSVSAKALFWTAAAALAAIIGLVITLFITAHGGG